VKAGYIPYTEPQIFEMLKAEIAKDKKAEKLIADFNAKKGTSLEAYAQAFSTKVDTTKFVSFGTPSIQGLGRESIMNVYAEHGKLNTLTGPVKGDNGVYVLNVMNRQEQAAEYNPQVVKSQLQRNYYYIVSQTLGSLQETMKVEDNRVKFF
jgi:peptidyl-prolyl cis-trans isomerase D